MSTQTPIITSLVHYQSYGTPGGEFMPEPRAAIITAMYYAPTEFPEGTELAAPYAVDLAILNPTGMFFNQSVPFAETPTPGHWNWPPSA